jgi:diguanylate cyclase (GGDEF)-like protein
VKNHGRNGDGPESAVRPGGKARKSIVAAHGAASGDQTRADADQTGADADQTFSDADQTASGTDQASANLDQIASNHDQATADRDRAAHALLTAADEGAYEASRGERETTTVARQGRGLDRAQTARERDATADHRDRVSVARDVAGRARDARLTQPGRAATSAEVPLLKKLEELGAQAAADRARAAADRERAARDRAKAARERARLEAELRSAYLDDLTGAYHRQMGRLALSHEIDRARRSDGRFVLAFVDVDGLKDVNDRDGHTAGDHVLQTVVTAIRTRLRSFDPIIRFGGDEFVCGLIGTDRAEVKRRFDAIGAAIMAEAHVGISVGLATLAPGDTADRLIERADATMLHVKAKHHSRPEPELSP